MPDVFTYAGTSLKHLKGRCSVVDYIKVLIETADSEAMAAKPTFLSINEAAQMVGYSPRHMVRVIERLKIPTFELRGKRFMLASQFRTYRSRMQRDSRGSTPRANNK